MKLLCRVSIILLSIVTLSCSTTRQAELTSRTPQGAVYEVNELRDNMLSQQVDLLAPAEFNKGVEKLKDAQEALASEKDVEDILDEAAEAKAHFQDAQAKANQRSYIPQDLLSARKAAVDTGLRQSKDLREDLAETDKDLRDDTDFFTKPLSPKKFSDYQQAYLEREADGVIYQELHTAEAVIDKAEANKAKKRAPQVLANAKKDYAAAANLIGKNSRNPEAYGESVDQANRSAKLLDDVMNKIQELGPHTSEKAALELVRQDRQIGKLTDDIGDLQQNLNTSQSNIDTLSRTVSSQESELKNTSGKLSVQQAMDQVRQQFNEDEAEVYQQGKNLIIRLKQMNFSIGSAELPAKSLELLSKVNEVVRQLDTEKVTVQGHTDSTGPSAFNQRLSADRAEAVAGYLRSLNDSLDIYSVGFGESKPLASNETKEGRAQNRRVDIVITTRNYMLSERGGIR